jgi:hypothetical protein
MALAYVESVVETLLTGAQSLREITIPIAVGSLTRIDIVSDTVAGSGGATFDVLLNGATIFPGGGGRPVIAAGAQVGSVTGLATAVARFDKLRVTCASAPATGVGGKLYIVLLFEDGTSVAGAPGSVWRDGAGVPSNALGIDGDYYLRDSNGDVYLKTAGAYAVVANIKGANGAAGAAGAAGQGFTFRNAWAAGTAYVAYDVVTYQGSTYLAIAGSTGILPPSDATKWSILAASANLNAGEQDLAWSNLSASTVDANNTLTNSSGGGAQAVQTLTGIGGYVRFKVGDPSESTRYFGLRNTAPDHSASNFIYYVQCRLDGTIQVWQNGGGGLTNVVMGVAYIALDELQLEIFDSGGGAAQVRLRKNGLVVATFTIAAPTYPLYFDCQLAFGGQHVYGAKIRSSL